MTRHALLLLIGLVCLPACSGEPVGGPDATAADAGFDGGADAGVDTCKDNHNPHVYPTAGTTTAGCTTMPPLQLPPGVTADKSEGIEIQPSGNMQPLGELEYIQVIIRTAKGTVDDTANGPVTLSIPPGVQLVSQKDVVNGLGSAQVRVNKAGPHSITGTLAGDHRSGKVLLYGYTSKLPIWRLKAEESGLLEVFNTPLERIWIDAELQVDGQWHKGKVRLHGGSSKEYPKKSLRFNLTKPLSNGDRKVVLRAEWRDKTMLRFVLSAAVARELAGVPISDLSYVHLRRDDGRFMGVMLRAERVGTDFLQRRGRDPGGELFEADPPFELAVPGGNLTPLPTISAYTKIYQFHAGYDGYAGLISLIEEVLQADEEVFPQTLLARFNVDSLLAYAALMAVIQSQDHVKKNYYLYRDTSGPDCRWEMLPWDLDLTFGHLWTPEKGLLEETLFTDGDPLVGQNTGTLFYNQLLDRVFKHPPWLAAYKSAVKQVLAGFTAQFVEEKATQVMCQIGPDLLADRKKRAKNAELSGRIDELSVYRTKREAFLKSWLAN